MVTLVPKNDASQNQVHLTRQEPYDWPASHRTNTCFWLEKARHTWFCLLFLAFICFWRILSQSETIHSCPDTYPASSHCNGLIYCNTYIRGLFGYTYTWGLLPFYTFWLLLLAEMVWITADLTNLDFSPLVFVCYTMWLLRTSYIAIGIYSE